MLTDHAGDRALVRLTGDIGSLLVFTAAVGAVCAREWCRRD
jgi:hypothetical protein